MIRLPELGVPDFAALLVNGRSPACWQRQIARRAAQPEKVADACHWLSELAQQHAPSLQSGPLLGACLSELVTSAPPAVAPEEVARPRATRSASLASGQARSAAQRVPRPSGGGQLRKPAIWPQSNRARHELLQKWAGTTAVPHTGKPTRQPVQPSPAGRRAPLPAFGQTATLHPDEAPALPDRLAQRIRQRLALPETAVRQPTSEQPSASLIGSGSPTTPQQIVKRATGSLPAQWQQPLFGQTAPQDLLDRLYASAMPAGPALARQSGSAASPPPQVRAGETAGPGLPGSAPPSFQSAARQSTAAWEKSNRQRPLAVSPLLPLRTDRARPSAGVGYQGETAVATPALPQTDDAEAGWLTAPRLAPPQMANRLPRLRPLPPPGAFASQPVAAATARESARREATSATAEAPEALHTLARQIKQILDEESRRHGIEV